jgi:hypothetical protein
MTSFRLFIVSDVRPGFAMPGIASETLKCQGRLSIAVLFFLRLLFADQPGHGL